MSEPIRFKTEDGREFVLEFSRRTVKMAEENGISLDNIENKMMSTIPDIFHYAFKMHQPWISKEETDRILFEEFKGLTDDELKRIVELYVEPYNTLINVTDGDEKNSRTVTFL